jgi:8-oxo-dGTP pyrophosphatase MutT (NUDIX family)
MDVAAGRVERVETCRLVVGGRRWAFADEHAAEIDAHWVARSANNPQLFNGRIHLLVASRLSGGHFEGELMRIEFKSYLYWRDRGFPDGSVRDAFGSALIRSAEGHVLLGRQREGNINAGLVYLPGGFIDGRDVGADGVVDLVGSVLREVEEETGLGRDEIAVVPGHWLTLTGPLVSIAVEVISPLPGEVLAERVRAHLAGDPNSELTGIVIAKGKSDIAQLAMPDYTPLLLDKLLAGT